MSGYIPNLTVPRNQKSSGPRDLHILMMSRTLSTTDKTN